MVGTLVVLVIVLRVVVDPVATHFTRKTLRSLDGYHGQLASLHVGLLDLSVTIEDLKLIENGHEKSDPVFYAEKVISKMLWSDLLRFRLSGTTRVESAKCVLRAGSRTAQKAKQAVAETKETARQDPAGLDTVDEMLESIVPVRAARIEVTDSELVFIDAQVSPAARLWMSEVEVAVENIATRERLTNGLPTTVAVRGRVQKSGDLTLFVSADPLAERLNFAGRMELRHLRLADLHDFLAGYTGLSVPRGTFDLFLEFVVKDDNLRGGVKPILQDVDITSADANIGNVIKEKLASAVYEVMSRDEDEADGRKVATTVPLRGVISGPGTDVYAAVLGILRNAFVVGLAAGFTNLPPPLAGKAEGPIERAREALSRESSVNTQPERSR